MENYDKISSEEYWNEDYLGDFNFFFKPATNTEESRGFSSLNYVSVSLAYLPEGLFASVLSTPTYTNMVYTLNNNRGFFGHRI